MFLEGRETLVGGDGDDLIYGNQGTDSLIGGDDEDTLYGGQGDDTLAGGLDRDTLYGGAGSDRFVYSSVDEGTDVIQDFDITADQILVAEGVTVRSRFQFTDSASLTLSSGSNITLVGVTDVDAVGVASGGF